MEAFEAREIRDALRDVVKVLSEIRDALRETHVPVYYSIGGHLASPPPHTCELDPNSSAAVCRYCGNAMQL